MTWLLFFIGCGLSFALGILTAIRLIPKWLAGLSAEQLDQLAKRVILHRKGP